mgnify:CR=1 FL=1
MQLPALFAALQQSRRAGFTAQKLRGDLIAGLTVGIIAIPLAMTLAMLAISTLPICNPSTTSR